MDGYDISYHDQSCDLFDNNQLSNNKQYIVTLSLNCMGYTGEIEIINGFINDNMC